MAETRTILHVFSTFAVGGPQRRLAVLARAMPHYRHLIAAMDSNFAAAGLLDGVEHALVPVEIRKGAALAPGNLARLRGLIRKEHPDLLCTYNWGSIEAVIANRLGPRALTPHIHVEDGFGPEESPTAQLPRRVAMRRMLLKATPVAVPSETLRQVATGRWGLQDVCVIPNGIDLEAFAPVALREDGPVVIGTVGALRPEKNFARLVEAFAEAGLTGRARLRIAGDGPERGRLVALIRDRGLGADVDLVGHLDDPVEFYRSIDVFAMSSDTEQMPLSLLEAMACGLPVAATAVGDIPLIVAPGDERLVVAPDVPELAGALARLVGDADLRSRLGTANREKAKASYGRAVMIEAWDRLFSEVMAR